MTDTRRYSRVYWSVMEDARFAEVWPNRAALGLWLQMLVLADASWPLRPNLPPDSPELQLLVMADLIIIEGEYQYRVRGMDDEKARRQEHGRYAAHARWNAPSNATGNAPSNANGNAQIMPSQSQSQSQSIFSNNPPTPQSFMGFKGRTPKPGEHLGQHDNCKVCAGPLRDAWVEAHK
jgi:hypothetical protein